MVKKNWEGGRGEATIWNLKRFDRTRNLCCQDAVALLCDLTRSECLKPISVAHILTAAH
jgi:hypothetical protein